LKCFLSPQSRANPYCRGAEKNTQRHTRLASSDPIGLFLETVIMAISEQQATPKISDADIVGNAFVDQYYYMLHQCPELLPRLYQDVSKLGRPEQNGLMGITTTMFQINKKILSLGYAELSAEIISVDSQESCDGGVIVLVTGFMIRKDDSKCKFSQCFFLAPQDKGYFVLNDTFRYVDEKGIEVSVHDTVSPVSSDTVADPSVLVAHVSQQIPVTVEDHREEVYNLENTQASVEEKKTPVPEVLDEIPDSCQTVTGIASQIENVPKKSYASVVKVMKENGVPCPPLTSGSVKYAQKNHEHKQSAPQPSIISKANGSSLNSNGIGNIQEAEAKGYSIYVKGLSSSATPALLENEFKKFGSIRSGGIQVRTQMGFCYGLWSLKWQVLCKELLRLLQF